MEDHRTACKLISHNNYLASIDLKESYLLVPMAEADKKYLRCFNLKIIGKPMNLLQCHMDGPLHPGHSQKSLEKS